MQFYYQLILPFECSFSFAFGQLKPNFIVDFAFS